MSDIKTQVAVPLRELRAARIFSSDDETRYVLCGVRIKSANGQLYVMATDGRRVGIIKSENPGIETDVEFSIPNTAIDLIWKAKTDDDGEDAIEPHDVSLVTIGLYPDAETEKPRLTISFHGMQIVCDAISGDYPKLSNVIPAGERSSANLISINGEYMDSFVRAANILLGSINYCLSFQFQGGEFGAIEVQVAGFPSFYGLIMPARTWGDLSRPEWLKGVAL